MVRCCRILRVDDNFNLRRVETANAELQRSERNGCNEGERELREVIETMSVYGMGRPQPDGAAQFFKPPLVGLR